MDDKLLLAVFSIAGGVIGSLLTYYGNLLLKRKDHKRKLNQKIFKSTGKVISSLQEYKDILQTLANNNKDIASDSESATEIVNTIKDDYLECFRNNLNDLTPKGLDVAHKAKSYLVNINVKIVTMLKNRSLAFFNEDEIIEINKFREDLTDYQNVLRDQNNSILSEL